MDPTASSRRRKPPPTTSNTYIPTTPSPSTARTQSTSQTQPHLTKIKTNATTDVVFLALFPLILGLGSFYASICPNCRSAPYDYDQQSHPSALAPSYFAQKGNVFNKYFVKVGWGWVSAAFGVLVAARVWAVLSGTVEVATEALALGASSTTLNGRPSEGPGSSVASNTRSSSLRSAEAPSSPSQAARTPSRAAFNTSSKTASSSSAAPSVSSSIRQTLLQPLLRWTLLAAYWFMVTQRFFGPPLIDRGFRFTGGRCQIALAKGPSDMARDGDLERLATAAACKAIGGAWRGGHDISGHAFLLVLGTAFLGFEGGLRVWARLIGRVSNAEKQEGGGEKREVEIGDGEKDERAAAVKYAEWFVAAVMGMNLWMLLMTAVYFHTWFEKSTGLATALFGIGAVYFLPRAVASLRAVVGSPQL